MRPFRTSVLALASGIAAAGLALLLSGCVPDASPSRSPEPSSSASASPSSSPSGSSSPAPSASARASTPVDIDCTTLVSNDTVYEYGPIYSAKSPFTPPSGSAAAQARADKGTTCEWINTSSGTTIDLSVAQYSGSTLAAQKSASSSGAAAVSEWGGDSGYYATVVGRGTATGFVGGYWIVASSETFGSATDPDPFMQSAIAAIRAR